MNRRSNRALWTTLAAALGGVLLSVLASCGQNTKTSTLDVQIVPDASCGAQTCTGSLLIDLRIDEAPIARRCTDVAAALGEPASSFVALDDLAGRTIATGLPAEGLLVVVVVGRAGPCPVSSLTPTPAPTGTPLPGTLFSGTGSIDLTRGDQQLDVIVFCTSENLPCSPTATPTSTSTAMTWTRS